jgi:hypothetical protein
MTSTMSRLVLTGALALGALAVIGGFTPGAATADAEPSVSQFAGSWSGTWSITAPILNEQGAFEWTISDAGRITGTVTVTGATVLASGTIVGHVGADGKLMFTGFAPNDVPGFRGGYAFQGTAVLDGGGKLNVSAFHMAWEGEVHHLVATLVRN